MNTIITDDVTDEEKYRTLFEEMYKICKKNNWGDPFSYARSREIHMAGILGHRVADDYSGADAYDKDDNPIEYKSTICNRISGTYNGISVLDTWEEQEEYIRNKKIGKYIHFIARYDGPYIIECWKLSGNTVLNILLPKIKKQYYKEKRGRDPRIGVTLCKTEIYEYGERII
mgnify:CR=1 FL=1|tara:strand:+ start:234 stop:749 length:516 start_codon:yes stop_codon:yes gene_type:complete